MDLALLSRPWLRRAPACLLLLVALSCSAEDGADGDAGRPEGGGTAIVALNADMSSFNPLVNTDLNTTEVNDYMLFTPIVQYDESFQPRPYLARSWDLTEDSVTFNLNRDVRWHDGRPVTAHDVAFTFRRAKDPETASILAAVYLEQVEDVAVLDSFTVRFYFARPHARPLDGFWWPPVPRHLLEDVPPAEMRQTPFNRRPVGSGPFRFVSWESGESLTLERNPEFSASLGGPPRLDRVIFRFIPESTTLLSETLSGVVDVNGSLQPHQAAEVENSPRVDLLAYPSREYYYIGWNARDPILDDARVRRALTMAIDRRQLVDALLFGHGELATGTIPPWHPLYTPIEPLPHDPDAAARLLEEAGFGDRDGDGIRESEAGRAVLFTLMTNHENPVRTDIAQIVQSQLGAVGADVEVEIMEWQALLSRHRARDFQGVVQSWVLDNFRVDPFALFHSSQAEIPGSYNRSGFADPEVDRLIEQAARTADPAQARALWADFARVLQERQPFTFLMWLDELVAVSDRLEGAQMDARGILVNVGEWWIPADRRRI